MASPIIKFKRSSVASKRPTLSNLELGEAALNTYDGKLFVRQDTGGVGIGTTITLVNPWNENFGATGISYVGNVNVTGIHTATSFVGDGSLLTNIVASNDFGILQGDFRIGVGFTDFKFTGAVYRVLLGREIQSLLTFLPAQLRDKLRHLRASQLNLPLPMDMVLGLLMYI